MKLIQGYTVDIEQRVTIAVIFVVFLFLIIVGRLYYLQIMRGDYYQFFSRENSIREVEVPALRGMIFDYNGNILVDNRPSFNLVYIPQYVVDKDSAIASVASLLDIDERAINETLNGLRNLPKYYPRVIKADLSEEDVARIKAHKIPWHDEYSSVDLRGIEVHYRYVRTYPDGKLMSHQLGYLREIDADRLKKMREKYPGRYRRGDFVGIGGIEEVWDYVLRGEDGYDYRIVDAVGRAVDMPEVAEELVNKPAVDGYHMQLTIIKELQEEAVKALEGKSGAVVALDPRNGAIRALYSSPGYDLNLLSTAGAPDYWHSLSVDPTRPLFNRALQGQYPPGSTYKIVTAVAGLAAKKITPETTIYCPGGLRFGGRLYRCWKKHGHGKISVADALTSSCDTFFYQLGLDLGVDALARFAHQFGLGRKTGLKLPREQIGLIPTAAWKERRYNVPWQAGENLSIAIGQGFDLVTPLQNASMISTIASNGTAFRPFIVREIFNAAGEVEYANKGGDVIGTLSISPEDLNVVQKGLLGVTESPHGTAWRLKKLGLSIAGKTGTAQVVSLDKWKDDPEAHQDHAWFVGYAPFDAPELAVAVIVEHGGFGASAAAPVVGAVMERYFSMQKEESPGDVQKIGEVKGE
jgi:penicillin-binding protein 2